MSFALKQRVAGQGCGKVAGSRPKAVRAAVVVRAQAGEVEVNRRAALGAFAGAAALLAGSSPSYAAFGDSANVFGKITNKTGYTPYTGDTYALLIPAKWNPSSEQEFPGTKLRYADNYFPVNNFAVLIEKSDKSSIDGYGDPNKFLEDHTYLLGKQSYAGLTSSEGGFAPNRVSSASLLDVKTVTDKKGKKFYQYDVLTRTADGDEGGRHHIIKAGVSGGNLYILACQAGDKRWIKTTGKEINTMVDSFTIA